MFLRRIVQHLKAQNWTAIGIELLIVVVGVFLGAQASNWNEERKVRDGERAFLARVHEDLASDNASLKSRLAFQHQILDAAVRTDAFVRAGRPCAPGRCWPVLVDFFVASQWQLLTSSSGSLEALQGSIYPYDHGLKRELIRYYRSGASSPLNQQSQYRQTLRELIPIPAQQALWTCVVGDGDQQRAVAACPAAIPDAEAGAIVERLRGDETLRRQLNFQASTLIITVPGLDTRAAAGDRLEATLKAKIE